MRYVEDNSEEDDHDLIHGHHHHHKRHNKSKDEDHEVLNGDKKEGKTEKESSYSESDNAPAKGHSDRDNLLRKVFYVNLNGFWPHYYQPLIT